MVFTGHENDLPNIQHLFFISFLPSVHFVNQVLCRFAIFGVPSIFHCQGCKNCQNGHSTKNDKNGKNDQKSTFLGLELMFLIKNGHF